MKASQCIDSIRSTSVLLPLVPTNSNNTGRTDQSAMDVDNSMNRWTSFPNDRVPIQVQTNSSTGRTGQSAMDVDSSMDRWTSFPSVTHEEGEANQTKTFVNLILCMSLQLMFMEVAASSPTECKINKAIDKLTLRTSLQLTIMEMETSRPMDRIINKALDK